MIVANRKGILPLSDELSNKAKTAMILPNLRSASLISMGQLCDDGCDVHFNEHALVVMKNKKVVMRGIRNRRDNLWDIPIQKRTISPQNYALPVHRPALHKKYTIDKKCVPKRRNAQKIAQKANATIAIFRNELNQFEDLTDINFLDNQIKKLQKEQNKTYCKVNLQPDHPSLAVIIRKKQTHVELAQYMHATCFAPVKSTFEHAVKKFFFNSWPGLTPDLVKKHLTTSTPTTQGHQHQEKQNLQSTKTPPQTSDKMEKIRKYFKNCRKNENQDRL